MMKALFKEKLDRSASNERRRCPGTAVVCGSWYVVFPKNRSFTYGGSKHFSFPPKRTLKLEFRKEIRALRSALSGIRARSAVRRGEHLIGVMGVTARDILVKLVRKVKKWRPLRASQGIDICK